MTVLLLLQMFEVDAVLTAAEQFVWGGVEAAPVAGLVASLKHIRRWASRVSAATKTKPTMQLLRPLLAADPPPMQHPGVVAAWTSLPWLCPHCRLNKMLTYCQIMVTQCLRV